MPFSRSRQSASVTAVSCLILGQMDLASASLRLPVVVEQTCRATSSAAVEFAHLLKKKPAAPELDRAIMAQCWDRTDRLNCCESGPTVDLDLATTIVLLQRDDYAHGEMGTGAAHWNRHRRRHMERFYRCRIVEAQQILIRWTLARLAAVAP